MINSECGTQECPLADLPRDVPAVIVTVPPGIGVLGWHGVRPGAVVSVAADAPLGGPRIVRVGGARLAIGRMLTRSITVRPVGGADGSPTDLATR